MKTFLITTTSLEHFRDDKRYEMWKLNMLQCSFNEDLHEMFKKNPVPVSSAIDALYSTSIALVENPVIAGAYVRRMLEFEQRQVAGVLLEAVSHLKDMPPVVVKEMADYVDMVDGGLLGYRINPDLPKGSRAWQTLLWAYANGSWSRFEEVR